MAVFDTVLDDFQIAGPLNPTNWGTLSGYNSFLANFGSAEADPAPALTYWKTTTTYNGNVFLNITAHGIYSNQILLLYRLKNPETSPTGYAVGILGGLLGNVAAELFLVTDLNAPLYAPIQIKAGPNTLSPGDSVGVVFTGTSHQIWYKPSGGAAILKGTFTDATVSSTGYMGMGARNT